MNSKALFGAVALFAGLAISGAASAASENLDSQYASRFAGVGHETYLFQGGVSGDGSYVLDLLAGTYRIDQFNYVSAYDEQDVPMGISGTGSTTIALVSFLNYLNSPLTFTTAGAEQLTFSYSVAKNSVIPTIGITQLPTSVPPPPPPIASSVPEPMSAPLLLAGLGLLGLVGRRRAK